MELLTHKFEKVMLQRISRTYVNKHSEGLVNLLEVCVDEFIAMSNDIQNIYLEKLSWAMMHGIQADNLGHKIGRASCPRLSL